jgi:hypothetical protein
VPLHVHQQCMLQALWPAVLYGPCCISSYPGPHTLCTLQDIKRMEQQAAQAALAMQSTAQAVEAAKLQAAALAAVAAGSGRADGTSIVDALQHSRWVRSCMHGLTLPARATRYKAPQHNCNCGGWLFYMSAFSVGRQRMLSRVRWLSSRAGLAVRRNWPPTCRSAAAGAWPDRLRRGRLRLLDEPVVGIELWPTIRRRAI